MYGAAALAAVALLVAGIALAADTGAATPATFGHADKLNLTVDQKGKLINLQEKYFGEKEKIRDQIVAKVFDLKRLYLAPTPDIKAIDKVQDEISALRAKNLTLAQDFRDDARALLTPDQLKADPYAFMGRHDGFGRGGFGMGGMGRGFGEKGKERGLF
jgi:Spy/CpxP family protein refolding chaperone